MMNIHNVKSRLLFTGSMLLGLSCFRSASAQLISSPVYEYEFMSWGDSPSRIQRLLGITWFPTRDSTVRAGMGSGRTDVFQKSSVFSPDNDPYFVLFEFDASDSGLIATAMSVGSLPGMVSVSDEFEEGVWEENQVRFGENSGGKWIPLVGQSKEWDFDSVQVKMIRKDLPPSGVLVKYVYERKRP